MDLLIWRGMDLEIDYDLYKEGIIFCVLFFCFLFDLCYKNLKNGFFFLNIKVVMF